MNCANPDCGHASGGHALCLDDIDREECLVGLFGGDEEPCTCRRFVPPREPLMTQFDALIESRGKR